MSERCHFCGRDAAKCSKRPEGGRYDEERWS